MKRDYHINELFGDFMFSTKKFHIFFKAKSGKLPGIDSIKDNKIEYICVKRRGLFNLYASRVLIDPDLFFKVLPSFEEIRQSYFYLSDKKVDSQIERLLKLVVFR